MKYLEKERNMGFTVRKGLIAGRAHIIQGINCQDSLQLSELEFLGQNYLIGIVSDGCGEGQRSETGAHLATALLSHMTKTYIESGVAVKNIPHVLFPKLLEFLESVSQNFKEEVAVDFIKNHLLFTVLGFVVGPVETVIFTMGDGVVVLNDFIDLKDENNAPNYPAYHLVNRKYLKKDPDKLPKGFAITVINTASLNNLVIATDSWESEVGALLSLLTESRTTNLQRTMNKLSQNEKRFKDDAAIIMVTRN